MCCSTDKTFLLKRLFLNVVSSRSFLISRRSAPTDWSYFVHASRPGDEESVMKLLVSSVCQGVDAIPATR